MANNNISEADYTTTEKLSIVIEKMNEQEKERILWIGEGLIFANQIQEYDSGENN